MADDDAEENTLCICDTAQSRNYARYYDSPDGCNIPTKIMVASRYGAVVGLVFSTYDILMYSHAQGFSKMLSRYMYHTVPLTLMGATFAAVSNAALIIREKDDPFNYFLGGLACGPIVASYLGSAHGIVVGGILLGVIGMIKKTSVDQCVPIFPDVVPHMGHATAWRNDWTLTPDPKKDAILACQQAGKAYSKKI